MTHYLFLAEGFEEIEALTPVDVLRRAGEQVKTVSVTADKSVAGAHGVVVVADVTIGEADFSDAGYLILPGGMPGTLNLGKSDVLCRLLKTHAAKGGKLAAICAAPSVLGGLELLQGREAICYPGFEDKLTGARVSDCSVVCDDNIVTAAGPGVSLPFALALVADLKGQQTADQISAAMLFLR
ncbi:MAG: DJ-1/PfpI family protein [Paludibacteraceae bacterium]|nr:DJ-1/PfpI family protein [Paludibacteraceae bacterium]